MTYLWATNPVKLNRAIAEVRRQGLEPTEEAVKFQYKLIGGLVNPNYQESALPPIPEVKVETAENLEAVHCNECVFVAKSNAGLAAHKRFSHKPQLNVNETDTKTA